MSPTPRHLPLLGCLTYVACSALTQAAAGLRVVVAGSGQLSISRGSTHVGAIAPGLFEEGWRGGSLSAGATEPGQTARLMGRIRAPGGVIVDVELQPAEVDGALRLAYSLTPRSDIRLNSLHVVLDMPIEHVAGLDVVMDGESQTVPEAFGDVHLHNASATDVAVNTAFGERLRLTFGQPAPVLLQDNRQWGPSFSVRIGEQFGEAAPWPAGKSMQLEFLLSATEPMDVVFDAPVTIAAGDGWVPLTCETEIEPGSALDFSAMGLLEAPAGKHGWLISRPDGTFAFEQAPDTPQRFYGVNLCFSAHYLAHEQADRLAERLARMGYNAVRVHHYERELVRAESSGSSVADIPLHRTPSRTEHLPCLETPGSEGDRYGERIRGYLHPPADGAYTFRVAGDDEVQCWLSTDHRPEGKRQIARVPGWTGKRQWDKHDSQTSEPVQLRAGHRYYIEILHKEGTGGDHVSVGWEGPALAFDIVAGTFLSTPDDPSVGKILREVWSEQDEDKPRDSTTPIPEKLDQLDYLLAALKKRGLYITTDLFVSRPVYASEIWDGAEGDVSMDAFKMAVAVNERALENWKAFARNLLTHRNPYTGLTYAEEPALAWLSMINEGNVGNHLGRIDGRVKADWQRQWNRFLAAKYNETDALRQAWGTDPGGDPREGSVPLGTNVHENSMRGRDLSAFCATIEARMFARMKAFVRDDLGCKALLTNMNGWTNRVSTQAARADYDYVDDHFYVDHPHFLENPWSLPSRCPNTSPVAAGAPGGRGNAFVRLLDKPFTISEYNYSGPGRFRGVGGILTGCLGALQGWDVIWRFAYSHTRANLFSPSPAGYFDIVSDPLNQVAERAAVCLYLRRDMQPAPHTVAIAMDADDLLAAGTPNHAVAPGWTSLAWVTRVGTVLVKAAGAVPADIVLGLGPGAAGVRAPAPLDVQPYAEEAGQAIVDGCRQQGWLEGNRTDLKRHVLHSETGELLIDAPRDVMVLNTPRTQGGYAPEGEVVQTDDLTVSMDKTYATVWVSSLDGAPIRASRRLLVCHLTDLQNTGARFGEQARKTLLAWGGLPHLAQAGSATVRIRLADADRVRVWALAMSGKRVADVATTVEDGALTLPLNVRGPEGARLMYEVAVE